MSPEPRRPGGRVVADVPAADLAQFNRWLCVSRLRAAAGVAAFAIAIESAGIAGVDVGAVLLVCGALSLVSALGLLTRVPRRLPRTFFYAQSFADIVGIAAGIVAGTDGTGALVFSFLFALVVVPMGLVSVASGLAAAAFASACHVAVMGLEFGFTPETMWSLPTLGIPVLLLLILQQCWFYAGHLARKNRALAELADRLDEHRQALEAQARTSHALFDLARTLASTTDASELLRRLNDTVATHLEAPWAATFLVDADRTAFRLVATTAADAPLEDLARLELPAAGWPAVARLDDADAVTLAPEESRRVPTMFTGGRRLETVLLAGLHTDGALTGFLAVGFGALPAEAHERALAFLRGMAQHASLVLRNARLLQQVRLASDMKSEFVGAISHELRSPLNVTLGYLEMLGDEALGPLTAEQRAALDTIRQESISLLEMITALLDLNRLEAGRLPIARATVDVAAILREVLDRLPSTWRRPGVALTLDVAPHLPPLYTDAGKLKTIVRNLVHNALKFTERGWVTLGAHLTPAGDVAITVRDTGCGIPPDALDYIFDMFRQVPGSGGGGVGLGLHLVWRLVTLLGGTVQVESQEGQGTVFTVSLPPADAAALDRTTGEAA